MNRLQVVRASKSQRSRSGILSRGRSRLRVLLENLLPGKKLIVACEDSKRVWNTIANIQYATPKRFSYRTVAEQSFLVERTA